MLWLLLSLVVLLALALVGLWVWAGSEGSLATALRWAGAQQPLVTDEVTGTVRGGGKVRRLVNGGTHGLDLFLRHVAGLEEVLHA